MDVISIKFLPKIYAFQEGRAFHWERGSYPLQHGHYIMATQRAWSQAAGCEFDSGGPGGVGGALVMQFPAGCGEREAPQPTLGRELATVPGISAPACGMLEETGETLAHSWACVNWQTTKFRQCKLEVRSSDYLYGEVSLIITLTCY